MFVSGEFSELEEFGMADTITVAQVSYNIVLCTLCNKKEWSLASSIKI
jgi:hypothetical protein